MQEGHRGLMGSLATTPFNSHAGRRARSKNNRGESEDQANPTSIAPAKLLPLARALANRRGLPHQGLGLRSAKEAEPRCWHARTTTRGGLQGHVIECVEMRDGPSCVFTLARIFQIIDPEELGRQSLDRYPWLHPVCVGLQSLRHETCPCGLV